MTRRITPSNEPPKEWSASQLTKEQTHKLYMTLTRLIANTMFGLFEDVYAATRVNRALLSTKPGHYKYSALEAEGLVFAALLTVLADLARYPSTTFGQGEEIYTLLKQFYDQRDTTNDRWAKPPITPEEWKERSA